MRIIITKEARKDIAKIKQHKALTQKLCDLLAILEKNPFQTPPPYEKLSGNLGMYYSRRINIKHRLVYTITEDEIKIVSAWSHYDF